MNPYQVRAKIAAEVLHELAAECLDESPQQDLAVATAETLLDPDCQSDDELEAALQMAKAVADYLDPEGALTPEQF
jgi:hypothetical protein